MPTCDRRNRLPHLNPGGLLSCPFIFASQNGGRFAIWSIESSSAYKRSIFESYIKFANIDQCLFVVEGKLKVEIEGSSGEDALHDGKTVVISASQGFKLDLTSPFIKIFSIANRRGIKTLFQKASKPFKEFILPDKVKVVDSDKLTRVNQRD